jgi:hypothetical protein
MGFSSADGVDNGEPMLVIGMLLSMLFQRTIAAMNDQPSVRSETLLRSSASWDGQPYESYPSGRPELTILKISLLSHTQLEWHSHPMPSAAYIVAGELTLEKEKMARSNALQLGRRPLKQSTPTLGELQEASQLY